MHHNNNNDNNNREVVVCLGSILTLLGLGAGLMLGLSAPDSPLALGGIAAIIIAVPVLACFCMALLLPHHPAKT